MAADLFGLGDVPAPPAPDVDEGGEGTDEYRIIQMIPAPGWRARFKRAGDHQRGTRETTQPLVCYALIEILDDPEQDRQRVIRPMVVDAKGQIEDAATLPGFVELEYEGGV